MQYLSSMKAKYFRVFVVYGTNIFLEKFGKNNFFEKYTVQEISAVMCFSTRNVEVSAKICSVFHSTATSIPRRNLCIISYLSIIAGLRQHLPHV